MSNRPYQLAELIVALLAAQQDEHPSDVQSDSAPPLNSGNTQDVTPGVTTDQENP